MKKILNTFKYGDIRTKLILILTILAGIGTIALFVFTFILEMMILFFGGVICAFITISLAQTFGIKQEETNIPPAYVVSGNIENVAPNDGAKMGKAEEIEEEVEEEVEQTDTQEEKPYIKEEETYASDDNYPKEEYYSQQQEYIQEEQATEEAYDEPIEEEQTPMSPEAEDFFRLFEKSQALDESVQEEALKEEYLEKSSENEPTKKKKHFNFYRFLSREDKEDKQEFSKKKKSKNNKKVKAKKAKTKKDKTKKKSNQGLEEFFDKETIYNMSQEDAIARYDKKVIKKVMHKYKVKRDHRMVIVDYCEKLNIKQTAAYIWVADKVFNLLLIDREPRHFTLPIYNLSEITYKKKVPANAQVDYGAFKANSVVANMFNEYLPDYSYSTVVDDLTSYKNLYGIGPGIYFTNSSAANLFDLLGVPFVVEDKVTASTKVNMYFKESYKANIMLRDNVIDANGYADKISKILDDMAHSTISYNEFKETLNLMIKNKLITEEFASYFMDVRDKISR